MATDPTFTYFKKIVGGNYKMSQNKQAGIFFIVLAIWTLIAGSASLFVCEGSCVATEYYNNLKKYCTSKIKKPKLKK